MNIQRLKKLRELALRGVGGEKENAKQLLDELCEKYGISQSDLDENEVRKFELSFHGDVQRKLLMQIIYMVMNDVSCIHNLYYTASGRKCRTAVSVTCTEAQKMEIEFLHEFYCRLWESEVALFLEAFIQKHELFGTKYSGDKEGQSRSLDELARMRKMMMGLVNSTPRKLLEG